MARRDPEAIADIVLALWDRIDVLETKVASLEMNSRNSSKPPSSDKGNFTGAPEKKRKGKARRRPGGRKGHKGHTLERVENPDRIVEHLLEPGDACPECGARFGPRKEGVCGECEKRQVFELPALRLEIIEHRAEKRQCENCGAMVRAAFPEGVAAPAQYGPALQAAALYLGEENHIPYHRLARVFRDMFGAGPGVGTLANFVVRAGEKAKKSMGFVRQRIAEARAAHFDETGLSLFGRLHWLHCASTRRLTCYHIDEKRGAEAMRNFGILEKFHGRAVHDYFKSYYQFENFLHSLCNAHLIRELIFLDEKLGEDWASEMIGLLLEAKLLRTREDNRPAGRRRVIGEKTRKRIRSRYFEIVAEGRRKNPEPDPPPKPKRGRPKRGKQRNMLDRLESRYDEVMAFFEHEGVPFDNNQAERDLRMAKLRDKISGTFRSARHALAFCNLHGVMSTARKQKRPMLETLGELLSSPEALGKSLASQG